MIPEQLVEYPLIRVCRPDCRSHDSCNSPGKRPVATTTDDDPVNRIRSWVNQGGNYGVVARSNNDLVIFDSDSEEFSELLMNNLPSTFVVESGGPGHGKHFYYRCENATRQTGWENPEGSVRVRNWHCVGPCSTHPDTGNEYNVETDREIAITPLDSLESIYNTLDSRNDNVQSRGGSGGGSSPPAAPSAHCGTPDSLEFIRRDDRRNEITEILRTNSDHSRRVWMTGWLYAAAGLDKTEIVNIIMSEARWTNLDRDIVESQVKSVIDSSRSNRGTHYTEFGTTNSRTADMDGKTSERRKTESGAGSPDNQEVTTMASNNSGFTTQEKVIEYNDDDEAVQARLIQGIDDETGEKFQYIDIGTGTIEQIETVNGEIVEAPQINDDPGQTTTLGSPEKLELKIQALQELKETLDD